MDNETLIQCGRCRCSLETLSEKLVCPGCKTVVPLRDGIPGFTENQDYFFGEISREDMRELARAVDNVGWETAFEAMCEQQTHAMRHYIQQYIADASRANWKYLLHLPEDGTVLDFGCGWGETTLSLARSAGHVVSMDLTLERLLLLRSRARDCGLKNVSFAHGGDTLPLPFADGSFDTIVLNGVLEWVPVSGTGNPRDCQLAVLRELRRTLKPAGQLYVGIENRVGLKYFLGGIDEHSHLKYTSLMPRWLANRWARSRTGDEYRTYTYSREGYTRLLAEAGFSKPQFYCPWPDYREFDRIVPVTTSAVKQLFRPASLWKRMVLKTPAVAQLLRWSVPSFSIIAATGATGPSRFKRLIAEISRSVGLNLTAPAGYHSKPIGEVFAFCTQQGENAAGVMVRISEMQTAIDARLASAQQLQTLFSRCEPDHGCMAVVPRSLGFGTLQVGAFTVEEIKPGVSWQSLPSLRQRPAEALLKVAAWLTDFQLHTLAGTSWDPDHLRMHVTSLTANVARVLPNICEQGPQTDHTAARGLSLNLLPRIPAVVCHGDLHLDNALFTKQDARLSGIVDWDLANMRGLPLTDLVYLLLMYAMEVNARSYSQSVESILNPSCLSAEEQQVLSEYQTSLGLDDEYYPLAVQVAVLQNIVTLADRRPHAFRRMIPEFSRLPTWLFQPAAPGAEPDLTESQAAKSPHFIARSRSSTRQP